MYLGIAYLVFRREPNLYTCQCEFTQVARKLMGEDVDRHTYAYITVVILEGLITYLTNVAIVNEPCSVLVWYGVTF